MSFTEHGFSTQVFLNHGGAIEVEKQQFALHILILNSGGKTDQLPDVLVAFGTAGRLFPYRVLSRLVRRSR